MRRLFICLASIVLLAFSCQEPIPELALGGIAGVVLDKTTGEPVPTVNVKIMETGAATVTGSDGSFSFRELESGRYTLTLSKEGYKDNSGTVTVSDGKTIESHLLIERIPAVLTLDREVLDFGDNISNTTLSFSMVNKNYVAIDWEIVYNCKWIANVDPEKSLAKLAMGKTQTVVVTIDRSQLQAGENKTVIVVRTDDGSSELTLKATGQAKSLPALNVSETTDIRASTAILNAEITDKGIPEFTKRGFVLGDTEMPTKETATKVLPATVDAEMKFSVHAEDLILGQTYYVRAYAENSVGIAYSTNQDRFKTLATSPAVRVLPTTEIKSSSALLNAEISEIGDPEYTECGLVLGDEEMPTRETAIKVIPATADVESQFSAQVLGLTLGQTYYVRAYAENSVEIAYSTNQDIFTTVMIEPEISEFVVVSEDRNNKSATIRVTISEEGDPPYYERGLYWGYEDVRTWDDFVEKERVQVAGSGVGSFTKTLSFPSVAQPIYVGFYAFTSENGGWDWFWYPEVVFPLEYIVLESHNLGVQKSDINESELKWDDAVIACKNSRVSSLSDWRLPTKDELYQLYLLKNEIGGFKSSHYWSSDSNSSNNSAHYYVDFNNGSTDWDLNGYYKYVRCVRTQNSPQPASRSKINKQLIQK